MSLQSSLKQFSTEESFKSESVTTVQKVKKVKKVSRTTTKSETNTDVKAESKSEIKTAVSFDKQEELYLMETSGPVVTNRNSLKEKSSSTVTEETKDSSEKNDLEKSDNNGLEKSEKTKKRSETILKKKTKKSKKSDSGKENISVKSSFSKFDALQKKENSSQNRMDSVAKSPSSTNITPVGKNCKSCGKVVFQMEQIKAERSIWHKNCFRCKECNKQLNDVTYQSHEGILYCQPHFKSLFAPKVVEDNEPVRPRRAEMIIRENQPTELPPDVVRASDKPDLGLSELNQVNIKSAFQLFENHAENKKQAENLQRSNSGVKRSTSILSKLARFKAKGMNIGGNELDGVTYEGSSSEEESEEDEDEEGDEDIELVRARRAQVEPQISFGNMNDMKSRFESGAELTKEERREERKQEIQNIRSRLFLGKQARIKEMYQQAVADSEQTLVASSKKVDLGIGDKARSLKERFEKGDIGNDDEEEKENDPDSEIDVFEQGFGKKSRSMFMELDANLVKSGTLTNINSHNNNNSRRIEPRRIVQCVNSEDVVKSNSIVEDVKIETADICSKFKFFETYKPNEKKEKKQFRITPPRDGVVKMPSPEKDFGNDNSNDDEPNIAEQTHTASKVLSMFRQMEESRENRDNGLKPLKRFTPPPGDDPRYYREDSGSEYSDEEYDDYEDDEEDEDYVEEEEEKKSPGKQYDDEFLKAAISAERAKKLREKFEKWEKNEIQREQNNSSINLYDAENEDESQVETASALRQRFESMRYVADQQAKEQPRVKVNRFV